MSRHGFWHYWLQTLMAAFGPWRGCSHSGFLLLSICEAPRQGDGGVFSVCIGVYLIHAYFYFRSRSMRSTVLLFGFLIILLICNVSGCRDMIHVH